MKKFKSEQGAIRGFFGWLGVGILLLIFALFFGVCSLFDGDDDHNGMHTTSLGAIELIDHDYSDGGNYGDEDNDYGYGGDYRDDDRGYSGEQECENSGCGNENSRGRNRGAFSPGPFDRSPVDFRDNCISLDCGDGNKKDEVQSPEETQSMRLASLFPPTPEGIRDFVTGIIKSGLAMGQLFADVTIKFVGDLMVGLA